MQKNYHGRRHKDPTCCCSKMQRMADTLADCQGLGCVLRLQGLCFGAPCEMQGSTTSLSAVVMLHVRQCKDRPRSGIQELG